MYYFKVKSSLEKEKIVKTDSCDLIFFFFGRSAVKVKCLTKNIHKTLISRIRLKV